MTPDNMTTRLLVIPEGKFYLFSGTLSCKSQNLLSHSHSVVLARLATLPSLSLSPPTLAIQDLLFIQHSENTILKSTEVTQLAAYCVQTQGDTSR